MSERKFQHRTVLMRAPFSGDGHTIIANRAARDQRLSWKARGILLYLGSHTEGWQTSEENLAHRGPDGLASVRSGLVELEANGYLYRFRERHPDGRLGDSFWIFSDDPDALPLHVQAVLARMAAEGRRLEQLPVRKPRTKRTKQAADPTCENRIQATDEQNRRSEPTCEKPKLGEPMLADRMIKKTNREGDGGGRERARPRETDPTPAPEPIAWGARGGRAAPTQADADAIAAIVARCLPQGDGIRPVEHQELATALATAVATVEADGFCSRDELVEWLGQGLLHDDGRPRWREDLVGVLAWRLRPENYRLQLLGWRARQRAEDPERGPRGERDPFDVADKPEPAGVCGVHRTTLTANSQCLVCLSEVEAEQAAYGPQTNVDSPEPPTGPVDPAAGSDGDSEDPDEIRALIEQSLNSASRRGADHGGREGRGWTPPPVVAELRERLAKIQERSA